MTDRRHPRPRGAPSSPARRPRHRLLPRAARPRAPPRRSRGRARRRAGHAVRAERLRAHRARTTRSPSSASTSSSARAPTPGSPTIVAEELDADWSQMRAVAAPADDEIYKNLAFGAAWAPAARPPSPTATTQMRKAGATARAHAGRRRRRRNGACRRPRSPSRSGRIRHAASGRESGFGALAEQGGRDASCRASRRSRTRRTSC